MQRVNEYKEHTDGVEQFILQHRPLVKKIALFIKRRLPSHVEFDDLLQSGLVGLLEARKHYRDDAGASFETYASIRIRGAIIDSLRKNSWVSRDAIKNMKKMSEAILKVEQRNKKQATAVEIAEELGLSSDEYFKLAQDINNCYVLSLDDIDRDNSIFGNDVDSPHEIHNQKMDKENLKIILEQIPEKEKLVLSLYYVEEFTFKQIGEILELTEARICQLHTQALARVRGKMK